MAEPLTAKELMAEVHWMLDGHVHPLMIAQQLRRTGKAIYEVAYREKDERVKQAFGSQNKSVKKKREMA